MIPLPGLLVTESPTFCQLAPSISERKALPVSGFTAHGPFLHVTECWLQRHGSEKLPDNISGLRIGPRRPPKRDSGGKHVCLPPRVNGISHTYGHAGSAEANHGYGIVRDPHSYRGSSVRESSVPACILNCPFPYGYTFRPAYIATEVGKSTSIGILPVLQTGRMLPDCNSVIFRPPWCGAALQDTHYTY
jgi:hypothetical protein